MNRDSLATLVVPLVAIACCLGLPIIASVAVGATVLVLGLGLPLALAMLLAVWVAVQRHRRMIGQTGMPVRRWDVPRQTGQNVTARPRTIDTSRGLAALSVGLLILGLPGSVDGSVRPGGRGP